jgi:hypothetical protein
MKKNYLKYFTLFLTLAISLLIISSCDQKNHIHSKEDKIKGDYDEYDEPGKAAAFENMRNMDPATGTVPRNKIWSAILQTEDLKKSDNYRIASANALDPLAWVERGSNTDLAGPFGNSRPGGSVTSGRMRTLWVDLADPTGKTVWVGGVAGGLWKTNDVTATIPTWILINDYLTNLAVSGICQDPTNTNTMYFCTGESYFTGGGVGGVGVFKSTDHGVTWTQLTNTARLRSCTKILCDATGNVYVSTLGVGVDVALMRSSNGGSSWTNINPFEALGVTQTSRIPDFEISSTGRMHVIGGFSSTSATLGGYRYTDNPAADRPVWQSATTMFTWPFGNEARTELTTVGNTIYASLGQPATATAGGKIEKIARSTDGGDNWTTTDLTATNINDLNGGGQGGYSQGIIADPSTPTTVVVGSLRLLKSTDGGVTFSKISEWVGTTGQYVHADVHNMAWYDNGNKLLVTTDGGLFYSPNKGTNFSDKNTGLRLKQFYGVAIHPTSTNYFLAGSQDNGTHQFKGAGLTSSVEVLGGDGGYTAIDQNEPQFQIGTYVYANFRRSSDGGATWFFSGSGNTSGLFINPYDYDNAANKVYAGYDAGQFLRWDNPQSGFTFVPVSISQFGTALVASATVSPYTANRVFFGMTNGKVFQLDNADQATPIVTEITPTGIAQGFVNSVIIGSSDQNITVTLTNAFATSTTSIWNTTNGGTNWTGIDGNLPEMPVYSALYHPDEDTKMYIATEAGVWSTDLINGTSTIWTAETTFPTVKTSMLKYRESDRTIAASTYGRGLWTAIIPNAACRPAAIIVQPVNTDICAGSNTNISITATGTLSLTYQWQLSTTGSGGPWNNINADATYSNVTTPSLSINAVNMSMNTYQYRCLVTGNCIPFTATSNSAMLTVKTTPAAPIVAPASFTYCQGSTSIQLKAVGENLKWYSAPTGSVSTMIAPTPPTSVVGTTTYYVSQTLGTCESPRAAIVVNVNAAPTISIQPENITSCTTIATFKVVASGTTLSYQWQKSTDDGLTFNPIDGEISSTLVVAGLTNAQANYKYRVVVSSQTCISTISNVVTAKVGINPEVTLKLSPTELYSPLTFNGLYASVTPTGTYVYEWKRNAQIIAGNTTSSLTKTSGIVDELGTFQVSATNPLSGCVGVSNFVTIKDNPDVREKLLVAPNPTKGALTVTYYSESVNTQNRSINVYDEKGSLIMSRSFLISGRYGIIDIDLTIYPKGTYIVVLTDSTGKQITNAKVIKN